MDKASSVIAAFDAGKLPSQQQINDFIDWFLNSGLSQVEPTSDQGELSQQGKVLVGDVRELLTAYKLAGEHKNGTLETTHLVPNQKFLLGSRRR